MTWTRDRALALMHQYTTSESLRKHMYAVEIAMRAMADSAGEDPDAWGIVGLLHDFDYERWPNDEHDPNQEHPAEGVRLLAQQDFPEEWQEAIMGHAAYTGTPRTSAMAKALFAVDELCGFLVACALVRPSRSLGGTRVFQCCWQLEQMGREGNLAKASELLGTLEPEMQRLLETLREFARTKTLPGD